jgi:hypothetical protein
MSNTITFPCRMNEKERSLLQVPAWRMCSSLGYTLLEKLVSEDQDRGFVKPGTRAYLAGISLWTERSGSPVLKAF